MSWKQAIVETSYNTSTEFGNVVRMSSLTDWKKIIECKFNNTNSNTSDSTKDVSMTDPYIAYFRHGSQDSRDIDVLYQFEKMPDNETILNFERGSGDEDRNIFTVDSTTGIVKECHRGIPDEVNNALLATYPLHEQVRNSQLKQNFTSSNEKFVSKIFRPPANYLCQAPAYQRNLNAPNKFCLVRTISTLF